MALDFQYDELMLASCKAGNCVAGNVVYGYEFTLRYPSYRGTFLSCIEALTVKVDGISLCAASLRFSLKGKQFLISELPTLWQEYWFVLDDATITVMQQGGLEPGNHKIEVEIVHRVPYTGYFGEYLTLISTGGCTVNIAKEGGANA